MNIYTSGSMKLRLEKREYPYALFERLNTGDSSTRYWVIGWCTDFNYSDSTVTWANGSYFENNSVDYALEVLRRKCK